jgi:hypothetical protein
MAPPTRASRVALLRSTGFMLVQTYDTTVLIGWHRDRGVEEVAMYARHAEVMPIASALAARRLLWCNVGVLALLVLHDLDHLRQADDADFAIPARLFVANFAAYVPTVLALYLCWRGDRRAPMLTMYAALWWIAAFVAVHLVGAGSFYGLWTTPYPELGVDWISWTLFAIPIGGAAITALVAQAARSRASASARVATPRASSHRS